MQPVTTSLSRRRFLAVLAAMLAPTSCAAPPPTPEATPAPVATPAVVLPSVTPTPPPYPLLALHPDRPASPAPRAVRGGPPVRLSPDPQSPIISGLYYDSPLALLEEQSGTDGARWFRTRLWGVLDGWIRADHLTIEPLAPVPPSWEGQGPVATPTPSPSPTLTLAARGSTNCLARLRSVPGADWRILSTLDPGTALEVQAWRADEEGHAWYNVLAGANEGWIYSANVDLRFADPTRAAVAGRPLADALAGKGMWLPRPMLEMADERQLVAAARALGLSHIWLQAGSSGGGFYARDEVARFLPAAHAAGLRVLAWLTTSLYDLPRDVELSATVANYRTADGHGFDGIAPDVEQNLGADDVRAFAEITRARLGDEQLLVGVIYPAGGWFGRRYPVHRTLARACNALAPMAYWKDERREYIDSEVYWYIAQVVRDLHSSVGEAYPVHIIGQMYDTFGRNGVGEFSPKEAEVRAALRAAREHGAIGASFFQWGTATPEEWGALRDFVW